MAQQNFGMKHIIEWNETHKLSLSKLSTEVMAIKEHYYMLLCPGPTCIVEYAPALH